MKTIKLILVLSILFFTHNSHAQFKVYRTFEDAQNDIGEEYDDYSGYFHAMGSVRLKLLKDSIETTVECKNIWGFTYKGAIFRVEKKYSQPAIILSNNNIVYYENGLAHLHMLKFNSNNAEVNVGQACYISTDINSEMIAVPILYRRDVMKRFKKFIKNNPEYKPLGDCILIKVRTLTIIRSCIEEFQKSE
ncbi:MAG: hypothetical protein IT221_04535 [Fluviicola sp.]|nr:hypothetical protein [Fluviicola sp.]